MTHKPKKPRRSKRPRRTSRRRPASAIPRDDAAPLKSKLDEAFDLHVAGRLHDALRIYHELMESHPDDPNVLHRAGVLAHQLGDRDTSVLLIRRAISLKGDDPEYYSNLATILSYTDQMDEIIECYERALELEPDRYSAHNHLAAALIKKRRMEEALRHAREAMRLKPGDPMVLATLLIIAGAVCDWETVDLHMPTMRKHLEAYRRRGAAPPINPFMSLPMDIGLDMQQYIAATYARKGAQNSLRFHSWSPRKERLRIAYLSPDFNHHAVGFLIRDLFACHDREQFEIFAFSLRDYRDEYTEAIERNSDHFVDLSHVPDVEAARTIHGLGVDILVDLAGHTSLARPNISSMYPAPLQCHFLGYPGTMGAPQIHYYITTEEVLRPEHRPFFTETPVFLPETPIATFPMEIPDVPLERSEFGLPEGEVVFCCLNGAYRIDRAVFESWMRILKAVPGSVLWLLDDHEMVKQRLLLGAEARGVDPRRIIFAEAELMSSRWRHRLADVWVDTFGVSGGTAGMLAAWGGLPVVTLAGPRPQSRTGAAIALAGNIPESVVHSVNEYEARAIYLATHPEERAELRAAILERRHDAPLFSPQRYIRHLEEAYRLMWAHHERGERPREIRVPSLQKRSSAAVQHEEGA